VDIHKKFRVWLLIGLVFLALGFSQGVQAADIVLNDLNGQQNTLSSYIGKPVILFFWTTWCPSCRKELKVLNQQALDISKEGIVILGVDVGEPDYKVKKYLKGYALNFEVLLDQKMELTNSYDLVGVPTFIFLNKDGKAVAQTHRLPANYKSLLAK
jgi:cytochrome c biogenesis protein CcmG, thiol:disulfide interchange protein DsbE